MKRRSTVYRSGPVVPRRQLLDEHDRRQEDYPPYAPQAVVYTEMDAHGNWLCMARYVAVAMRHLRGLRTCRLLPIGRLLAHTAMCTFRRTKRQPKQQNNTKDKEISAALWHVEYYYS